MKRGPYKPAIIKKISYATKLPAWLVFWLRDQDNAAKVIEKAIREKHGLEPPGNPDTDPY